MITAMPVTDVEWDALVAGQIISVDADVFLDYTDTVPLWVFRPDQSSLGVLVQVVRRTRRHVDIQAVDPRPQSWVDLKQREGLSDGL